MERPEEDIRKEHNSKPGKHKAVPVLFITICLFMMMIPSAGLFLGGREDSAENDERTEAPSLLTREGQLNWSFLPQAGKWFEENFAWRRELVSANARVMALAGVSANKGVILGTDGWLYYSDSLGDYQGTDLLDERAVYDIAHTARMTQDYCSYLGASYMFLLVPNKATMYPEHMPYYLRHRESEDSNRQLLKKAMESEGVIYLDAGDVLKEAVQERQKHVDAEGWPLPYLYHKTDSHWTNEGAGICADAVLDMLKIPHRCFRDAETMVKKDFEGDLEVMLYPAWPEKEEEVYFEPEPSYEYVTDVKSTFDYFIQTRSASGAGNLVMYRDSFANALLPFMAESFSGAWFSRGTPENVTFDMSTYAASCVITEHAERNLPDVAGLPPVLMSLPSGIEPGAENLREADASINVSEEEANAYFTRIDGILGASPEAGVRILVDPGDGVLYEAMPSHLQDGREGFTAYLPADEYPVRGMAESVRVYFI